MPNSISPKQLQSSLKAFGILLTSEKLPKETAHFQNDSRLVNKGDVFCAVIGSLQDGRVFIDKAIEKGACLVLAECESQSKHGSTEQRNGCAIVQFYQLGAVLFKLASTAYQLEKFDIKLIGVTGTNGKTTTTQLVAQLIDQCGGNAAVIGTVGAGKLGQLTAIANTTPGPTELVQLLSQFGEEGITHVAMEVSSHALEQQRVCANVFDVAAFTNLSRDHLDYHGDMESYAAEKFKLFTKEPSQKAVLNADDAQGQLWIKQWPSNAPLTLVSQQLESASHPILIAKNLHKSVSGAQFVAEYSQQKQQVNSQLIGQFNVDNLLLAMAILTALDFPFADVASAANKVVASDGRMESFSADDKATAIVDYAHTPDALENALHACKQHCEGELWAVFGCGGDRDKGKRPLMAKAAEKYADHIVITNDNPRSEEPMAIANDILTGLANKDKAQVILARQQAVISALKAAKKDDMVLLAGKGHEDYIIIDDNKIDYNERDVVKQFYNNNHNQEAVS